MKHRVYAFITVALYVILVIIGIWLYLPTGSLDLECIARDVQGNIYGVSSKWDALYVYEMDSDGNPLKLSTCEYDTSDAAYFCRYSSDAIYLAQVWYQNGLLNFSVWKKGSEDRSFSKIWYKTLEEDVEISDFYVEAETLYIAGIDQETQEVAVYYCDNNGNQNVYKCAYDFAPVNVKLGNEGIYVLSRDNNLYFSDFEGSMTSIDIEDVVAIMTDENGFYYQQQGSSDMTYVFYNGLGGYTYSDLGDVWDIQHSDVAQNNALLVFDDGRDRLLIVAQDGTQGHYVDNFRLGFGDSAKKCIIPVLVITIVFVAVLIVVYLFMKLVWEKRKLRYQTIAVVAGVSALWLVMVMVIFIVFENYNKLQDRAVYSQICMLIQKARLEDEAEISRLDYDNYKGSVQEEKIERILGSDAIGSTWQSYFTRVEIVYGVEKPVFVYSDVAAYGRYADTYYDAYTLGQIQECMETGEQQVFADTVSEITYVMSAIPLGDIEQQLCIVARVPAYGEEGVHMDLKYFYICSIVGWLVMVMFLQFFLKKKWKFSEVIVTQMDKASKGDYRIESRKVPDNEFGMMWTALERMCKNTQLQRYRQIDTLDYVNQFAPKNFERLFGRDKLQDIDIGETLQISATMGIISIIDRDTLLTGKLQRQYVQYVNQLMEILFSQEQSEQAIFLQNGSNLENVKVIFKEDTDSVLTAVRYSIDCIETLLGLTETKYDTKPFILLHTSIFSCGIAGGSKQVYPYVTSLEMETIGMYIEPLKNCGVRMAVTQSTWQQVEDKVRGRYIGYVSSKDGKESFKLYEILDAYSQSQKLGRLKNMENFDKAMRLYYANDLYLARSLFSDIVKECPDDGIARWYAFACDELFNREDNSDARYELFWDTF